MKILLAIFASALVLAATDPQATKKTTAPARTIKPLEIPKDAVETEPGTFRYTDSNGKKWIYRKTPFGVSRMEDKPEDTAAKPVDPAEGIKAVEDGDTVHFERPGPFGTYKWDKKKSELDDVERVALERTRTAAKADQK